MRYFFKALIMEKYIEIWSVGKYLYCDSYLHNHIFIMWKYGNCYGSYLTLVYYFFVENCITCIFKLVIYLIIYNYNKIYHFLLRYNKTQIVTQYWHLTDYLYYIVNLKKYIFGKILYFHKVFDEKADLLPIKYFKHEFFPVH